MLGRTLQRPAVFVKIRAKEVERGNFGKRIDKGGAETRHDIEVAATGLNKAEEARPIYAFAAGEDGVEVGHIVDDEIERLEAAITSGVEKVDHLDVVLHDEANEVGFGESIGGLAQFAHNEVGVHGIRGGVHR